MSIIGINGKIGSGKDTVGSIIQYLTSECGDINNKSYRDYETFVSRGGGSAPRQFDFHYQSNWEIKKFAGKLKTIASLLTGIPVEKFEDQEFKKTYLGKEWSRDVMPISQEYVVNQDMTVRDFLQILGTEGLRDGLHTNVWVNALMCDYKFTHYLIGEFDTKLTDTMGVNPNWVITDMRFPNELEAVKAKYGITISVVRHQFETANFKPLHASETALDGHIFDYYIVNDGTIEDLIKKVRQILKEEGIL